MLCFVNAQNNCPQICPMLYAPVCAVDSVGEQKTFASECAYNAENCRNPNASKYQN